MARHKKHSFSLPTHRQLHPSFPSAKPGQKLLLLDWAPLLWLKPQIAWDALRATLFEGILGGVRSLDLVYRMKSLRIAEGLGSAGWRHCETSRLNRSTITRPLESKRSTTTYTPVQVIDQSWSTSKSVGSKMQRRQVLCSPRKKKSRVP